MRIADWAVLIYSGPSRDIQPAARAALDEVAAAHLNDRVVVGAQLAQGDEAVRIQGGRTESIGPVDMSQPQAFQDFLRWGMKSIPARHYAVVVGGHAAGFLGAVTDPDRHRLMPLPAIASALNVLHPEVVAFNACLMGQAETACQLAPHGYLVATPKAEHGLGMPLGKWLEAIAPGADAAQVASALARACAAEPERSPAVTAFPLERAADLKAGLERLGRAILDHPNCARALAADAGAPEWDRPWDHPLSDFRDMRETLQAWERHPEVAQACHELLDKVPAGLSLYVPAGPEPERADQAYAELGMGSWGQAIDLMKSQAGRLFGAGPLSTPTAVQVP